MSQKERIKLTIPSKLEELTHIEKMSTELAEKLGLNSDRKNNLSIAITEAVGNAISHGNGKDPAKKVHIQIDISAEKLIISVTDEGKGFDPENISDPLAPENMLKESGRGIFILKQLMDDVYFSFDKGTTLTFVMDLNA